MKAWSFLRSKMEARDGIFSLQFFNALRQMAVLLGSIAIARSSLTLEEVGTFETLQFLNFLFTFVWYSALFTAYLRRTGEESSVRVLNSAFPLVFMLLVSAVLGGAILFSGHFWLSFSGLNLSNDAFAYFIIYVIVQIPIFFLPAMLMVWEEKILSTVFSFLYFSVFAIFFLGYYFFGEGLDQLLLGLSSLHFIFLMGTFAALVKVKNITFQLHVNFIKEWISSSLPLMLYSFLGSLAFLFDNWWINYWYDDKEVFAIFRYGARELPFVQTFIITLGSGMVYHLAKNPNHALESLKTKTSKVLKWLGPLALLLTLISPFVFQWVYGQAFKESAFIFNMYLLILFSRLLYSQTLVLAWGNNKILVGITFVELIINVLLSILWIETLGIWGVVLATLIAFFVEKISLMIYVAWKYKVKPSSYVPVYYYLGTFVIIIAVNLTTYFFLR